jgi:hypothetical protein
VFAGFNEPLHGFTRLESRGGIFEDVPAAIMLSGASGEVIMLLKTAKRALIASITLAGVVTRLTTLSAAALLVGISTSSFADSVRYAPHQRASNGLGCGYDGAFPCSAPTWGSCDDSYLGVFPCSSPGRVRRGEF